MCTLQNHDASNPFLKAPTLSILEKFLLRKGWRLENFTAPHDGRYMTRALAPDGRAWISYPHPAYHYRGQNRSADLRAALETLAWSLCKSGRQATADSLALELTAVATAQYPGFACIQCGACCNSMADAWQGRVSAEEVLAWEKLGLKRILRFVQRVERPEYMLYKAWVHPVSGRYLPRCPWLARPRDGRRICRIHAYRPLKCRSFPLSCEQAESIGCPGMLPQAEPEAAPEQDA